LSLRAKTNIIITVTLGALLLVMYGSSNYFLLDNYQLLERNDCVEKVRRSENVLNEQLAHLNTITLDWSAWNESYSFIANNNPDYASTNLNDANLRFLNIDIMLFYNNAGQLYYKTTSHLPGKGLDALASALDETLRLHGKIIHHQEVASVKDGVLSLSQGTVLISSRPIIKSSTQGPIRGTLVTARLIDNNFITQLAATTRFNLRLIPYQTWRSDSNQTDEHGLPNQTNDVIVRIITGDHLQGYKILHDILGQPSLVLILDLPRTIYAQGETSMNYYLISLLVIGLVFGGMARLWLERSILKRLYRLSRDLRQIKDLEHISIRMDVAGSDEISKVGHSINNMLAALEEAHIRLVENDIHLHRITDNMLDILVLVDREGKVQYCSPSFANLGYKPEILIGRSVYELIHPDERDGVRRTLQEMTDLGFSSTTVCRVQHAQGHFLWMESTGNVLRAPDSDDIVGIILVGRDITQRKAAEDSLIYLSEHDPMTSLYNGIFFRQQVTTLDRTAMPHFGAICCDLNGLRLVNDTMGYQVGDNLIVATAELLTACTPDSGMLARTGGDEFTMFLTHADTPLLDATCRHIATSIKSYNDDHPEIPLSLSMGAAAGTAADNVHEVLVEAAGNMYRDKLHQHSSGQSAIVSTLMQALQERDFITSGHADRMEKLVANMAGVCNLSVSQVNDLRLLARFHDIGKVGVKDSLLFKPNKLTAEEHKEMQRHCEVGYRIAQSAPHLRHISEWILKHHEWWNGEGYPLGLKGEDIPKECRILAIADAYDAMTSERPYRKPVSHEEALEELRRCAGTQFDPWITVDFICMWQPTGNEE